MALVFALNNMLTQNKDYLGLSFDIENEALLYEKSRILCSKKLSQYFSVKNQGENNPFFGKQHTDETKLKISESKSGQHWTEEQKLNQSIRLTGRKMSDEACKNIALSKLGAKNGASKAVKCIELDLTFDTIGEACKYLGVSYSLMGKYLKTNSTDKNNNHWAYVDTSIEKQDLPNFYTNFYNSSPNISIIDTCKQFNIGKYKLKNIFKKYNVHIKNAIEVNTGRQKSDEVKKTSK